MEINFKGFKNAGAQSVFQQGLLILPDALTVTLNCELTNNIKGKDLDSFERVLKDAPNKINHNFLTVQMLRYKRNPKDDVPSDVFYINDKVHKISMENLSLFQKIAEFLKKIINTPNNEFVVNRGFVESDDFPRFFELDIEGMDAEAIRRIYNPNDVKNVAKTLLKRMTEDIEAFLS